MGDKTSSQKIDIRGVDALTLCGHNDANLLALEARYGVQVTARGDTVRVTGPHHKVHHVSALIEEMASCLRRGDVSDPSGFVKINLDAEDPRSLADPADSVLITNKNLIRPRSEAQRRYVVGMQDYDVVFGIGPAGTGKTYLAVASAVSALRDKSVSRIILTRPAVEAGESLGFLPGDIQEKVDPYLRPLYDALQDMMPGDNLRHLLELRTIEIAPLAFMRGRTLNNAFVILDEAQNTTINQMKMFLTRLGANSRAVITGDITQVDLPDDVPSGLIHVQDILSHIEAIRFVTFSEKDVVRHRLVQEIINAYDAFDRKEAEQLTLLDQPAEADATG